VIGLTGNIACGKSLVLRALAELGAHTIDADQVAKELLHQGSPVLDEVTRAFGTAILKPDGSLDRKALAGIVFNDPDQLSRLEAIVHPPVVGVIRARVAESRAPVVVIDAIKLFEASLATDCDEVWVVTCRPEQQLSRLMARDGLSEQEALVRIRAQPPQAEKVRRAARVIDNSGSVEDTLNQVRKAWEILRQARDDLD
jgi:dephospho-CoA kinase